MDTTPLPTTIQLPPFDSGAGAGAGAGANSLPYSLLHYPNYHSQCADSVDVILDKYIHIVHEYLTFALENVRLSNPAYAKFVLVRGFETITTVFGMLLLVTRNLPLTFYNSQKALYYYIEFIGQVTETQHSFLNLNSKDAVMYVYKKTIFDLNNEVKRTMHIVPEDHSKFATWELLSQAMRALIVPHLAQPAHVTLPRLISFFQEHRQVSWREVTPALEKLLQVHKLPLTQETPEAEITAFWCDLDAAVGGLPTFS
jgi:hypothetical protein